MTELVEQDRARFMNAPSTCGTEFDDVAWTGTVAVQVRDDRMLGIRFNDAGVQAHVTAALGDLVQESAEPVPYYSVRLGTPGRRKAAPLHHLYFGGRPVLGTRDLTRLLSGLGQHLGPHLEPHHDAVETLLVSAVPVSTPAGVILAPLDLLGMTGSVDRLLTTAGFALAEVPAAVLDLAAGTVEVPEPPLDLSGPPETLAALGPSASEPRLPPGRHPLAGWLLSVAADQAGPLRPVTAVGYAAQLLATPYPHGAQSALDGLVALASRVPMTGVAWATPDELVGAVREAGQRA